MSIKKEFKVEGERTTYSRTGEFYEVSSTYGLGDKINKDKWKLILGDIDELQNKPRRFFDMLLTIIEHERDNDPRINEGNHQEYWNYLISGCEMWLSAVENGVYYDVIRLAEPLTIKGEQLRKEYSED